MINGFPLIASVSSIVVLLVSAISAAAEARDRAAASAPGEKVQCIPHFMIERTRIINDKTILFEMKNGVVWRNELPSECPRLKREGRFSYRTSMSQLCSMDMITLSSIMGIPGPSCGLGEFMRMPGADENQKKDEGK